MRIALVSFSCCVGLGLILLGGTKVLHAWSDQSLTSLKGAAQLETPVELNFDDVPLRTAVESLCQQANIVVTWDELALAEAELPADETVALRLQQKISLRSALNLVLEPCYLVVEIQGDRHLRITSRQRWNDRMVTMTYDVRDLASAKSQKTALDLPSWIQSSIEPNQWQSNSPTATGYIMLVDGQLQVTQRRSIQQGIVALLAELRETQTGK